MKNKLLPLIIALFVGTGLLLTLGGPAQAAEPATDSTSVARSSASGASAAAVGCVGSSFSGTLSSEKAICSGDFLVRMQGNGDLVLRQISSGRACWTSGTAGAWTYDASAVFIKYQGGIGPPAVEIHKTSQGLLKTILGSHQWPNVGTNANVNASGGFWIGYKKIASC